MAKINSNVSPYFDTTQSEVAKGYMRLLARPGRVAQAREFTVLQGIMLEAIKSLGDSILSNGDIIEGCQIIVSEDKKSVTITEGKIYMEGLVSPVEETTLGIKGVGSEVIGVKIDEVIITDNDDNELRDPAQGYDNYGQSGCDRVKRIVSFVVDDSEASPVATLNDGDLKLEIYTPNYDIMTQTLARRTYDESGSYIVEGLKAYVEDKNSTEYTIVVEPGKAYILGYELKIPTARRITAPKSLTTSKVVASNYLYSSGTNSYILDNNPYVNSIDSVRGRVSVEEIKAYNDQRVQLSNKDVVVIKEVGLPGGATKYNVSENGDCYLVREGTNFYLQWTDNGSKPAYGNSYYIKYEYNTDFIQGTDYTLDVTPNGSYIKFTDDGEKPLDNFSVTYYQYLARKDIVTIDQEGNIVLEAGIPAENGYEQYPEVKVNVLELSRIYNPPNSKPNSINPATNIVVDNVGLTRFTMNDIQGILDRVKKTEYNQAILSLNDDAKNRNTPNSKKGILTDPLIDFSRIDLYFNKTSEGVIIDPNKPVYEMALDLDEGIASLPVNIFNYDLNYDNTYSSNNLKSYNRLVTLGVIGEREVLSQSNATKSFLVNPYSLYPQQPELAISPAVDSWVENEIIEVPISLTDNKLVKTTTNILYKTARKTLSGRFAAYTKTTTSSTSSDVQIGSETNTYTTESLLSEQAIAYMRQIELTITGSNFLPGLDNIRCTFDSKPVKLIPVGDTSPGSTVEGTVKANGGGYFQAKFMIPENVRTGVREVRVYSDTVTDGYVNSASNIFQSTGVYKKIQRTITTIKTILLQRHVTTTELKTTYVDPVGQTFVLDRTAFIKGIDLYFEYRPSNEYGETEHNITAEIRSVENGTIGSTIYAQCTLPASEVKISSNASVPTRFNFEDPIVLEQDTEYAFVVRSLSNKYRIWVSEIGGTDVYTNDMILKNSYLTGVMMSSSNNSTWTAHQTMDIKFKLYEDLYNRTGSVTFDPIQLVEERRDGNNEVVRDSEGNIVYDAGPVTMIDLSADTAIMTGTKMEWFYSIDGGNSYISYVPGTIMNLNQEAENIVFKVNFERDASNNLTPILAKDSLLLVGTSYKKEGDYISVNVTGVEDFDNVMVIMDVQNPAGLTVKASPDNGVTLYDLTLDNSQTVRKDRGWMEHVYVSGEDFPESNSCRIFIHAKSNNTYSTPQFSAVKILMN